MPEMAVFYRGSTYIAEHIPTMPTEQELDALFAWGRALGITAEQLDGAVREVRRMLHDTGWVPSAEFLESLVRCSRERQEVLRGLAQM